jgi:5-methylcytosine-specific restriction enzyme subunit McrC
LIKNCCRLSEYEKISGVALERADAETLAAHFVGRLDIAPAFGEVEKYRLTASQYIGAIALPAINIIIEPKTPIANLAHMISIVYDLPEWQKADLDCGSIEQWCELVALAFVNAAEELLRQGLNQGYSEVSDNLIAVKGQIQLASQFGENLGQPIRHRCAYAEFSFDLPENRIIKLALDQISYWPLINSNLIWRLARARAAFANISLPDARAINFDDLQFTRLNEHYRRPLGLARLVIEMSAPTLTAGNGRFSAFLVDMNRLFERYVAAGLQTLLGRQQEFEILIQSRAQLDRDGYIAIAPDIILARNHQPALIIDTKYKVAERAADDCYQMLAYCLALNVRRAVLAYPAWEGARCAIAVKNSDIVIESAAIALAGKIDELANSIAALLNFAKN